MLADGGEVDAPAIQNIAAEVGHEHIADAYQFQHQVASLRRPHVQRNSPLAPLVLRLPSAPGPCRYERHLIEYLVGFHLDDFSAQRPQNAPGERQSHVGAKLYYADSSQCVGVHGIRHIRSSKLLRRRAK